MMDVLLKRALASNWHYDSESSTLNLLTWVFTITAVSSIIFILGHRMYASRRMRPKVDEILLAITGILEFVQAADAASLLNKGYSMSVRDMNEAALETFMKAGYIKSFFYVAIIAMAKISTLRTLKELTPQPRHRLFIILINIFVGACAVSSLVALGFRCALPHPWDMRTGKCMNRTALAIFICFWDIITDMAIVAMAFLSLGTLHISKLSRRCCLTAFSSRLLCIPISVVHVVYTVKFQHSRNFLHAQYAVSMAGQTHFLVAIIATSVPYITILADPLRNAYLAAVTRRPAPFRLSWPLKANSPKKALRFLNPLGNQSETSSVFGARNSLVQDMGLAPLGSTLGRASRASGSDDEVARTPRTTSRNNDHEEEEVGVKQMKQWTVKQVKLQEKSEQEQEEMTRVRAVMVRQKKGEENMRRAI